MKEIYDIKKEGFIYSDSLAGWIFTLDKNKFTGLRVTEILDNILREKLKFCYPSKIDIGSTKLEMNPDNPPLREILEKQLKAINLMEKTNYKDIAAYIEWSVNLYLKLGRSFKRILVKPSEFQVSKGGGYSAIFTYHDNETVDFHLYSNIWFPCIQEHNDNLEQAKKNAPLLNRALERLVKELKPKEIEAELSIRNGAKFFENKIELFKHGKDNCWGQKDRK